MIFSVFGTALTDGTTASTPGAPLPTKLAGATLLVNNIPAPLFYASPGQSNAQFPVELAQVVQFGSSKVTLQVKVQKALGEVLGPQILVLVSSNSPGIFTLDQNGKGPGAILRNSDFSKICPPDRADCPVNRATRGEAIAIYMTGLGAVNGSFVSGQVSQQPSPAVITPFVTIEGVPTPVLFSGLATGFVGLYQVNVVVPTAIFSADAVPLVVSTGNTSHQVTIAIGSE